eukprot:12955948-Alexandrium_andersonii.AAC.1
MPTERRPGRDAEARPANKGRGALRRARKNVREKRCGRRRRRRAQRSPPPCAKRNSPRKTHQIHGN